MIPGLLVATLNPIDIGDRDDFWTGDEEIDPATALLNAEEEGRCQCGLAPCFRHQIRLFKCDSVPLSCPLARWLLVCDTG